MGFIKYMVSVLLVIGFLVGLILFLDEIHMVFPFLINMGIKGGFLGDLSQYHIEPFHHWFFGVLLIILCGVRITIYFQKGK
ncbi:MAG: hypothetical protein ACTSR2_06130 [Candidatus Hodarchaeales archaeon]